MKKIILLVLIALFTSSSVQARGGWGYGGGWMAPLLLGGVIGYEASRPTVVYDNSPGVVYVPAPQTVILQQSTPAPVVQQTTVVPSNTPVYEEREIYFDDCNCKKKVLILIHP